MREEPVLYINGRPFVVREADKPFANLEYTGIDRERVESMEARLKQDVLQEVGDACNVLLSAQIGISSKVTMDTLFSGDSKLSRLSRVQHPSHAF